MSCIFGSRFFSRKLHLMHSRRILGNKFDLIIAPDKEIPAGSAGQYLGLTNSTTDGNTANYLFAIELDTAKQEFDPDDNHIRLNINSIHSNLTVSLSDYGIDIASTSEYRHTVKITYDGEMKNLKVEMDDKKLLQANEINIREYMKKNSYFGFAASTGSTFVQLNAVLYWKLEVNNYQKLKSSVFKYKILIGVGILSLIFLMMCVAVLLYFRKKRRFAEDPVVLGVLKRLPGTPREFMFKDLKQATNNFDEKFKLGQGGFGVVYKGVLIKENVEVAVKQFSRESMKGKADFLAELCIINRLRHKNLVRLLGWCYKKGMLLLVYDYMPNGSLDNHLYGAPEKSLSWENRIKILTGVAHALHYLHNEYDQKVVHRDLKASNIMLDAELNARLGDFGLARALDNGKSSYAELSGVAGTRGYIAPEYMLIGKATRDSDIYGFGAVVLDVICGCHPWSKIGEFHFLIDWVWSLHRDGIIFEAVDETVKNSCVVEEVEKLLLLGLACSHPLSRNRPKAHEVLQIISGSLSVPYVPPFKPAFSLPTVESTDDEHITTQISIVTSSHSSTQR